MKLIQHSIQLLLFIVIFVFNSGHLQAAHNTQQYYRDLLADPTNTTLNTWAWEGNTWGNTLKFAEDYQSEGWPEAAHCAIENIRRNFAEATSMCYDGVGIEGLNYQFLSCSGMLWVGKQLLGYTDTQHNYTPPAGYTRITSPLTYDDLFSHAKRRQNQFIQHGLIVTLPNGMDSGAHDSSVQWRDLNDKTKSMERWAYGNNFRFHGNDREDRAVSYLMGGFGQVGLGSMGRIDDPYLQTQAILHFSGKRKLENNTEKWGTGHACDDSLSFSLYGRGRALFQFPAWQNQNQQARNKNQVLINNQTQSWVSDISGKLEFMHPMPGLQIARVDASHIKHKDGYSGSGAVNMNRYRRTLLSNTVDPEKAYVLDIFEVDGGTQHMYNLAGNLMYGQSFHSSLNLQNGSLPYSGTHWDRCSNEKKASYGGNDYFWVDFRFQDDTKLGSRTHVPAQGEPGVLYVHYTNEEFPSADRSGAIRLENEQRLNVNFNPARPQMSLYRSVGSGTLKSTFVLVHEVKDGVNDTFISSVTKTVLPNKAVAVKVTLKNGREDIYLVSFDGRQEMNHDGFSANAAIAATSKLGGNSDLWMVDGSIANNGSRAITSTDQNQTGSITKINRLQEGDASDSIETSLYLPRGDQLCGQTILVEHIKSGSLKMVNGHTIDRVEAVGNGSRIYLRDDPGIEITSGRTEELFFPYRAADSARVRFVPMTTSVPYIAKVHPDPEQWQTFRPRKGLALPLDNTVRWTTLPERAPVEYSLVNSGVNGVARESLVLGSDTKLKLQAKNPEGLTASEEIVHQFWAPQPALKATPGASGLSCQKYYGNNYTFTKTGIDSFSDRGTSTINGLNNDDLPSIGGSHGAIITGYINIPTTGFYTFYSRSERDGQLTIGDHVLISQSGMRAFGNWSAEIYLEQGLHELEYHLYTHKDPYLQVRWEGPGISYQPIPHDRFYRTVNWTSNPSFSLSYSASTGGQIQGSKSQTANKGGNGTSVTAVATDSSYQFMGWSDGVTAAQRQDKNIQRNLSVEAMFEKKPVTITYKTSGNGVLAGPTTQSIPPGTEGVTVEAIPGIGYTFSSWSDGLANPVRTDIASTDRTITANFIVATAPVASFTATPTSGTEPLTVAFDASGSSDSNGTIQSYAWDFDGDGVTDASGVRATHVYTHGTYNATLTVTDNDNESSSDTVRIVSSLGNALPTVTFVEPLNGAAVPENTDLYVKVNAGDADGSIANLKLYLNGQFVRQENAAPYEWGLAGQNDSLLQGMSQGAYTLEAIATDNEGATGTGKITITVGTPVSTNPPAPRVWYKFDETSGNIATDSSTNGFNGTINGPTFNSGKFAGGLEFTGSGEVTVPTAVFDTITNQITVAFWLYDPDATATDQAFVYGTHSSASGHYFQIGNWSETLAYAINGDNVDTYVADSSFVGAWHHFAFTKDSTSGEMIVYMDGVEINRNNTKTQAILKPDSFMLGKRSNDYSFFTGTMDDFRMYDEVLSASEIQTLLSAPPTTAPSAAFTATPTSGTEPLEVIFDASASSPGSGSITGYAWDFDNDGSTDATGSLATNTYSKGTYTAKLTVTDNNNLSGITTEIITVNASSTPSGPTPVAWYKLDETSGTTATDSSGNGHTGTANRDIILAGATGQYGAAASFRGGSNDDYIDTNGNVGSSDDFTATFWAYPTQMAHQVPLDKMHNSDTNNVIEGWEVRLRSDGKVRFNIGDGELAYGDIAHVETPSTAYALNTWVHVAVSFESATETAKIYIDGTLVKAQSGVTQRPGNTTIPLRIGRRNLTYAAGDRFGGSLDDIRIFHQVLTDAQITAVMNNNAGSVIDTKKDSDSDGVSDFLETAFGTNPNAASDKPNLLGDFQPKTTGDVDYQVRNMTDGYTYELQTSTNLTSGIWNTERTFVGSGGPSNVTVDKSRASADGKLFLRIKVTK